MVSPEDASSTSNTSTLTFVIITCLYIILKWVLGFKYKDSSREDGVLLGSGQNYG